MTRKTKADSKLIAALHEALRGEVITRMWMGGEYVGGSCLLCNKEWAPGEPERHADGCLCDPKVNNP